MILMSAKKISRRGIRCPSCGSCDMSILIKTYSFMCSSCGWVIDFSKLIGDNDGDGLN